MAGRTRLLVSFSGGRSSAYMLKRLWDEYQDVHDMVVVFANTGEENEKTLVFVDRCSRDWGIPIVWLEAVVHMESRLGCSHRVVDFATASRAGEPFEQVIRKYGIPNMTWPHCTRELKLNPIKYYLKEIGWQGVPNAVGIRADELRRVRKDAQDVGVVYPMVDWFPTDKPTVNDWWAQQPFDLGLLEHQGNCKWCWKKSLPKLVQVAKESPEAFSFPARMEATYGLNGHNTDGMRRVFFRQHRSTQDIISIAELLNPIPPGSPDMDSGCSESCEAF